MCWETRGLSKEDEALVATAKYSNPQKESITIPQRLGSNRSFIQGQINWTRPRFLSPTTVLEFLSVGIEQIESGYLSFFSTGFGWKFLMNEPGFSFFSFTDCR